jgi:two-component system cell cycle response regulator DivK
MATILIVEDNDKNMPALVLMDIQLPGISGIEALRQLRANAATASIPVIAVTASVMASDRREITDAGFDGYVSKPISLRAFLDAVRVGLEGKTP